MRWFFRIVFFRMHAGANLTHVAINSYQLNINMSKVIKLKRGLDIKLVGEAEKTVVEMPVGSTYAVVPDSFPGITPKLLVSEGERVQAGSPLFFDKKRPEILFTAPVSGVVSAIKRGEKRRILAVVIDADSSLEYKRFQAPVPSKSSRDKVREVLLQSGLWPLLIQRPYGLIADPSQTPKAIFISGFDSAPLAPDMNFVLRDEYDDLNAGIEALKKLTDGKVHLGLRRGENGVLNRLTNASQHTFAGPHPAGNVGIQIHHIDPIAKGEIVWTVDIQNVAVIGRLFNSGKVDLRKTVAITGSEIIEPEYVSVIAGTSVVQMVLAAGVKRQRSGENFRIIMGNVLTGVKTDADGYLDYYHNQLTIIPEGDKYELLGWIAPRFDKFSVSRSYFSWLMPNKRYNLDTNLNGGKRALVVTGLYDRYLPMNIYPLYLLKACMVGDIDKMENLGIYEVLPEDFALCEFVDPSKTDMQAVIANGIDLMIKELS